MCFSRVPIPVGIQLVFTVIFVIESIWVFLQTIFSFFTALHYWMFFGVRFSKKKHVVWFICFLKKTLTMAIGVSAGFIEIAIDIFIAMYWLLRMKNTPEMELILWFLQARFFRGSINLLFTFDWILCTSEHKICNWLWFLLTWKLHGRSKQRSFGAKQCRIFWCWLLHVPIFFSPAGELVETVPFSMLPISHVCTY